MKLESSSWRISPILGVRNVREAAEYYRDVLGFELDPDDGVFMISAAEPSGVYAIVKRESAWIHFQIRRGELSATARHPVESDAYVYVTEVDKYFEEVTQRGAKILRPLEDSPYGLRDFVVEDLNDFRIVFGEFLP